jgi:hypothetical protein
LFRFNVSNPRYAFCLKVAYPPDQRMDMLGYHHVTHGHKMITASHLFQHLEKQVSILPAAEHGAALITTGSDKVETSSAVVAMEPVGHSE